MSKDRARPFSRKHRRYWIPVTGGMILLGVINVVIGYSSYSPPTTPQRIELVIPKSTIGAAHVDAGTASSAGARSDAERREESIDDATAR